jgi:paraquat-inducible protein A
MSHSPLVCHECDLIITLPEQVAKTEKLVCPRCHHSITLGVHAPKQRVFAVALSCLALLFVANLFPFLTFETQGRSQSISLLQTASEMYVQDYQLMGKLISSLLPWCMADVFFTGVVVALIKIIAMADIVFGIAFYSYLLFALFFLYLTQVMDLHRLWSWYQGAFEHDR